MKKSAEVAELRKANAELLAVLRDVEWAGVSYDEVDGDEVSGCPWCEAEARGGEHAGHCKLAQAIAKAEGLATQSGQ